MLTNAPAVVLVLLLAGCARPDAPCSLPDGSPAGFVPSGAPGHQVAPAGTSGYYGCPR